MVPKGDVTQQYCLVQPKEKAPQAGEAAAATPTPPEQQPQSANPRAFLTKVAIVDMPIDEQHSSTENHKIDSTEKLSD
ncbi:hypothetical protein OsI_14743 [Oryza sativa Indica Group]|uniref:Uncharacterized protein n=1 Tax=Oryza sativa subsp. indica TaxID=39946 RepID=B8AUY1_ORYSI|nr:hypothetical protein OsI_14743 [Oryza sativa Indica Group]